jgi:hypothetical protein
VLYENYQEAKSSRYYEFLSEIFIARNVVLISIMQRHLRKRRSDDLVLQFEVLFRFD